MELVNTENTNNPRELSEKELDALYIYLDMYVDSMDEEEKEFWIQILAKVDKEFYDDKSNGSIDLQNMQSTERGT